jgi:hypothetical protein
MTRTSSDKVSAKRPGEVELEEPKMEERRPPFGLLRVEPAEAAADRIALL